MPDSTPDNPTAVLRPLSGDDAEARSADVVAENLAQLRALFPEAFTEGGVDFEVLKQLLGGAVDEREEKYGLNWHGKRQARQLALTPSSGTLLPRPEESVDWDTTQNLIIEGDNLEVLKLLQKSYAGKVKLIYIDPPYNTGKDFVYPDNYRDSIGNYLEITGQTDGEGRKVGSNSEASGRFHTDWLNMMYPRLKLAKNLLREDGSIFISIDDGEVHHLRSLLSEVFGEENFVANIVWQKRYVSNVTAMNISDMHDHVLVYARDVDSLEYALIERTEDQLDDYQNPDEDPRGPWRAQDLSASKPYRAGMFDIRGPSGTVFSPPPRRFWRCNVQTYEMWLSDGRITFGKNGTGRPMLKSFLSESQAGIKANTWWDHSFAGHNKEATLELKALFDGAAPFDTPKPVRLLKRMLHLVSDPNALVLDFFAGSGTMAHAIFEANSEDGGHRRFILVQFPEPVEAQEYNTIAEITEERVRRAGTKLRDAAPLIASDVGFRVLKLAPSNIRAWDPSHDALAASLELHVDHIVPGRTEQDILYELLLKLGLELTVPIEQRTIAGKTVYSVGAGVLLVCLAEQIASADVEPLALGITAWHKELAPAGDAQVVVRDSAFTDDVAKTNLVAILQQHGLLNVRSL